MANVVQTTRAVAPTNLEGGFRLEVEENGLTKTVIVPKGGVLKGETFIGAVELPRKSEVHASLIVESVTAEKDDPPTGKWRDGLCSFCIPGVCHPLLWMSWCCTPVVLGQVMTRMRLNFIGSPGSTRNTCSIVTKIWLLYMAVSWIFRIFDPIQMSSECLKSVNGMNAGEGEAILPPDCVWSPTALAIHNFMTLVLFVFVLYFLIATCRTRRQIRTKYAIPPSCCQDGLDDCCSTYWCTCCVVSQMARHTNDYDEYPVLCCTGDCFSNTGQNLEATKHYNVADYKMVANEVV